MKRIEFSRYGGPETMVIAERALPPLERNRVRVRVVAAAINPLDWKLRNGAMKIATGRRFPQGMGSDFSGVVEALGAGVGTWSVGQEVFGTAEIRRQGAFAEFVDASPSLLAPKPSSLSFSEAACLPIPGATAWAALSHVPANLGRSAKVLIHGCSGAVGRSALQIALSRGMEVVGVCGRRSMADMEASGATHVACYGDKGLSARGPYDLVFDTLGTLDVREGLALLRDKGRFTDINPTPRRIFCGLLSKRYKLVFATGGFKHLPELGDLATQGILQPVLAEEVRMSEFVEAIRAAEAGQGRPGRVILAMPPR